MIHDGNSRRYINDMSDRIKRIFRWGVCEELVPPDVYHGLQAVPGLRKGRSKARETEPIVPVADAAVNLTLDHMPAVVADMIRFQRFTGGRPGEVCSIRPVDVDTSSDVWIYRPESHKTQHHGRERAIAIGPKAQDVLRPYLLRPAACFCFSPAESEKKRRAARHEDRKTPIAYGNRPGSNCKLKPKVSAQYNRP